MNCYRIRCISGNAKDKIYEVNLVISSKYRGMDIYGESNIIRTGRHTDLCQGQGNCAACHKEWGFREKLIEMISETEISA